MPGVRTQNAKSVPVFVGVENEENEKNDQDKEGDDGREHGLAQMESTA
jgi:hypothetical protein